MVQILLQQQRILPEQLENQILTVEGRIISTVTIHAVYDKYGARQQQKHKFSFELTQPLPQTGALGKLQLDWLDPKDKLQPGDVWRFKVKLKRPRNFNNPGSFNIERYCLQQRIIAMGYVVPKAKAELIARERSMLALQLQQKLLHALHHYSRFEYIGVIAALVLGNKTLLSKSQLQLLQDTGTAHLIAISGMHLTLIASIIYLVTRFCCLRMPWNYTRRHALAIATLVALGMAYFYAKISGFGVATQRAFVMLVMAGLLSIVRYNIVAWQRYWLAVILVVIYEPLVLLAPGFWYSFLAVAALLHVYIGRKTKFTWWQNAIRPQFAITVMLLPLSLWVFGQVSTMAIFVNLIAIPYVTLLILPLAFIAVVSLLISEQLAVILIECTNYLLAGFFKILKISNVLEPYIWHVPETNTWYIVISATLMMFWFLAPAGIPRRHFALLALLPIFFSTHSELLPGQAIISLLDVGQGLALVIRTKQHTLVYDTGAAFGADFDMGANVVVPFLHYHGVKRVDLLMISHSDNDHIGGARSILQKITTEQIILNDSQYLHEYHSQPCIPGSWWVWDEVMFKILHPNEQQVYKKRNNSSCVLMIQAADHKILLTGDIEAAAEQDLIAEYGTQLQADILLVPHHGSKTSSTPEFLKTVQPDYALVAAGYKNQYGHPKHEVLQRYKANGIDLFQTVERGAVTFKIGTGISRLEPQFYLPG